MSGEVYKSHLANDMDESLEIIMRWQVAVNSRMAKQKVAHAWRKEARMEEARMEEARMEVIRPNEAFIQ